MAAAPTSRGQSIGRPLVRAAADIERQRGRRMLTGYVWDDALTLMYERWVFIVSPPETAGFFLPEELIGRAVVVDRARDHRMEGPAL